VPAPTVAPKRQPWYAQVIVSPLTLRSKDACRGAGNGPSSMKLPTAERHNTSSSFKKQKIQRARRDRRACGNGVPVVAQDRVDH